MPVSITDELGLTPGSLESVGAFDAILDVDSRLFIDPYLVRQSNVPEFATAGETLDARFTSLMLLARRSRKRGDAYWREADRRLNFREIPGLALGYSRNSTAGSGIGDGLRATLLESTKEIVDAGIDDPRFFELMGLLEEGIGADRISDMTARIIANEIGRYSERAFTDLDVERAVFRVGTNSYRLPRNRHNNQPILLVPQDVLRPLPVAESWADIDFVVSFNAELRQQVNAIIGTTWTKARYLPKGTLKAALLRNPALFQSILRAYRGVKATGYNFKSDPLGEVQWYQAAKAFVFEFPMALALPAKPTGRDVMGVVIQLANQFKTLIEDNGLWKLLYNDDGSPKVEDAAQLLFFGIADRYCDESDIDISPETDSGRGEVDFKFSHGRRAKVVAEMKLTSNHRLIRGMDVQLEIYAKAERTDERIYVVIDVDGTRNDGRLEALKRLVEERMQLGQRVPVVIYVNGRARPSASHATTVD